jgi:hypothetical protein
MISPNVRYNECAICNHYPSYHNTNRPCRAFTDETDDMLCACTGWVEKPAGERNDQEREAKALAAKRR